MYARDLEEHTRIPRDLLILGVSLCFTFMGPACLQPFLVKFIGAGYAKLFLIFLYSSFLIFRITIPVTMQRLSDHWTLILGACTYTLFAVLLALTRNPVLLCCMAVLWGWGAAAMWTACTVRIVDVSERYGYGSASGIVFMTMLTGQAFGSLLLGSIASGEDPSNAAWVATGIGSVGLLATFFLPRRSIKRERSNPAHVLRTAFSRKSLFIGLLMMCSSMSYGLLLGPVQQTVSGYLRAAWLGVVPAAFYMTKAILSYTGGRLSDRVGRTAVIRYGFLVGGCGLLLGASWWTGISMVLCSLTLASQNALVPVAAIGFLGDTSTAERRPVDMAAMFVWRELGMVIAFLGSSALAALAPDTTETALRITFYSFAAVSLLCSGASAMLSRTAASGD